MKSNVDLTESRIFTSGVLSREKIIILNLISDFLPWDLENKPRSLDSLNENESWRMFKTGSKVDRDRFREWENMEFGILCDRCGESLTRVPWLRHYGLCDRCSKELENDFKKDWRFENTDEFNGNDLNRFFAR